MRIVFACTEQIGTPDAYADGGMSSRMIATVPPCVDVPRDLGVAEETFTVMMRERDRIDAGHCRT